MEMVEKRGTQRLPVNGPPPLGDSLWIVPTTDSMRDAPLLPVVVT
jgi:hypothetical protein